jgi:hypothetical protein
MTRINKLLFALVAIAAGGLGSCTKNFDSINTNPDGLYPGEVDVDYQNLGAPLNQAQLNILNYIDYNYQVQQNLNADIFSGFMMSSTPFNGNVNNTNYGLVPGWNSSAWDLAYSNVMAPIATVLATTAGKPQYAPFYAWAKLLRVEAMHRISDIYGPIIYTHYGTTPSRLPILHFSATWTRRSLNSMQLTPPLRLFRRPSPNSTSCMAAATSNGSSLPIRCVCVLLSGSP